MAAADPLVELYEVIIQPASLLGRLILVANLWNPQTGRYDRGLPERFHFVDADKALAHWHRAFFMEWLSLSLESKKSDVALYWRNSGGSRDQTKRIIRHLGEAAIPPLVRAQERSLFIQDLTLIQALLTSPPS